jgi:hypothetical protein
MIESKALEKTMHTTSVLECKLRPTVFIKITFCEVRGCKMFLNENVLLFVYIFLGQQETGPSGL